MIKKIPKKKIIIVGAGIAGLAACTRLIEYGFDVTIMEARDRCGGRIWTNNTLGIPFGLGASWIHGAEGNPIAQLAKNSHAKMVAVDSNKFITFDRKGSCIPHDDIQKFNEKFEMLLNQAKELAFSSKYDISLSSALSNFIKYDNFSSVEQELLDAKLLAFESYIGANNEDLSARHWDQDEAWPGENCFLTSSYHPIIENLVKNCPIQLNTIVTKINTRAHDIEIVTDNGDCK
jgi:phytoene dehydrogenase-like protein